MTRCNYAIDDFKGNLCTYKKYCDFKDAFTGNVTIEGQRIYGICKKHFNEDFK